MTSRLFQMAVKELRSAHCAELKASTLPGRETRGGKPGSASSVPPTHPVKRSRAVSRDSAEGPRGADTGLRIGLDATCSPTAMPPNTDRSATMAWVFAMLAAHPEGWTRRRHYGMCGLVLCPCCRAEDPEDTASGCWVCRQGFIFAQASRPAQQALRGVPRHSAWVLPHPLTCGQR